MKAHLVAVVLLSLSVVGCKKAPEEKGAIRKAMVEYLAGKGMGENAIDVDVKTVSFHGDEAEALVSFRPKGQPEGSGFQAPYLLVRKGDTWTVKSRKGMAAGGGANPHGMGGGAAAPNPHGATGGGTPITPDMMPPSGGQMKMPPGHPAVPKQ